MMTAAVISSRWVLRILILGAAWSSSAAPWTSGIMATPVSKPDNPSASLGKSSSDTPTIASGLLCWAKSACFHSTKWCGCRTMRHRPSPTTTMLSARYTPTSPTAMPMASLNPLRNTPPSSATSTSVAATLCPWSAPGT